MAGHEHEAHPRAEDDALARRLIALFDHPLREQRHRALAALVERGEGAVPALVEALGAEEPRARQGALRALLQIASPQALGALMDYVDAHAAEIGDNRAFAMQAICAATSPHLPQADHLFRWLGRQVQDRDDFVRAYTWAALGRLGDPRARPWLERGLKDKDPFAAEKAAEALLRLDTAPPPTAREVAQRRLSVEEITFGLQATDAPTREIALRELLARVHDEGLDALPHLLRLLSGAHAIGRRSALHALAALKDPRALPALVRLTQPGDAEADVQANALRAIAALQGRIPDESDALASLRRAIPHLLRHVDLFVRAAAVAALGALPSAEAVALLVVAAGDAEAWVRDEATSALLHHPAARLEGSLPELAALTARQLERAQRMLTSSGQPTADARALLGSAERLLGVILAALPDPPQPRHAAAAAPAGWAALAAPAARVRLRGLEVLGALTPSGALLPAPSPRSLQALGAALGAAEREVVLRALGVLERALPQGDASVTQALVEVFYRGDAALALRALPLLERAADPEARKILQRLAMDKHPEIAQRAREALDRLGETIPFMH